MAKLSQMVVDAWGRESQLESTLTLMGRFPGCPGSRWNGPGQAGAADMRKVPGN